MPDIHQNLIGKHFGHLTVIAKSKKRGKQGQYLWICQCDCGRQTIVSTGSLNSRQITSCGHTHLANLKPSKKRHQSQLSNRPPKTNTTGYRNISKTRRHGRTVYRVSVVYNGKQHSHLAYNLKDALIEREKLRRKWWPEYKG